MSEHYQQRRYPSPPPPVVAFTLITASWLLDRLFHTSGRLPGSRGLGLALFLLGSAVIGWSIWVFRTVGEGTPDPRNPPKRLVEVGPYRFVRHPGYGGGLLVLAGVAFLRRSPVLLALLPGFTLWLRRHAMKEEEELIGRFGVEYEAYRQRVPGWLPRLLRGRRGGATSPMH